MSNRGE
jgi:hypothetical protein